MKRSLTAVGAVLFIASLQGCAGFGVFHRPANPNHCTSSHATCFLDVYDVSGWHVDPDVLYVSNGARQVMLVWRLPQGYAFCDGDGVEFKAETNGQFSDGQGLGSSGHGKKQYQWRDANTAKGTFPYKVTFHTDSCSGDAIVVDPGVVNEM